MKVRLALEVVELIPENGFERDALHHIRFHGVKSVNLSDPQGASVLGLQMNPERLGDTASYNDAARTNCANAV